MLRVDPAISHSSPQVRFYIESLLHENVLLSPSNNAKRKCLIFCYQFPLQEAFIDQTAFRCFFQTFPLHTILIKSEIAVAVQLTWGSGHVCQVNYDTNTEQVDDSSSWKRLWNLPSKSRRKEMDKFYQNQALIVGQWKTPLRNLDT
jgi:hypothetical protein